MRSRWWLAALCFGWAVVSSLCWAIPCLAFGVEPTINASTLALNCATLYFTWGWWRREPPTEEVTEKEWKAELHQFRKENGLLD